MKIYVVIEEDRHTSVDAELFTNKDAAIAYAWEFAQDRAWDKALIEEEAVEDCVLCLGYSPEGDCVRVIERTLDEYA